MGGAFVCLTLFSSLAIACSLGTGTRVREGAVALSAGRWLSLSAAAYFAALSLALFPAPCLAYGEELEPTEVLGTIDSFDDLHVIDATEGVKVLDDGEELPVDALEETFDVRRIDDGMLLAVKGSDGTVVVKSVVSPEPLSTAAGMLWDYLSKALTRSQLVYAIENDLAWRWYHADSAKRAKVPLVPSNDSLYTPLNNDTFTSAGSAQEQYDRWYRYNHQFWPLTFPYKLRTIDGGSWSPTSGASITDFQNYAAWYNWFEDINDTPSGGGTGYYGSTIPFTKIMTTESSFMSVSSRNLVLTETQQQEINEFVEGNYSVILYTRSTTSLSGGTTKGRVFVMRSTEPITVTYTQYDNSAKYKVTLTTEGTKAFRDITLVNRNDDPWTMNGNLSSGTSISSVSYCITIFASSESGGTVVPSPEPDPVFPTSPTITTPQQPNVTINAPTYNTYTTNETTSTTTDLIPILNAIRILNDNVQTGFDNMAESLDTHFDNVHRMLEAWFTDFSNWLELIYEELQQVNRYLEAIYFNTDSPSNDPIYPDLDDGNTVEQQTDVNLELLKKKFPTSIPWDLYGILTLLETAPVAPSFTLPVVMTEYTITIDLSDFNPMAAVSRKMSVLLFAVGLLINTKKLASIDIGASHGV